MANECLVTKLKGTVNNDNLPKYNVMSFSIDPSWKATSSSQFGVFIVAGSGGNVKIKAKKPFTPYGTAGTYTEWTIIPNSSVYMTFTYADFAPSDYIDAIEIENYYNVTVLEMEGPGIVQSTPKQNYMSLINYAPLEEIIISKEESGIIDLPNSVYYITTMTDEYNVTPRKDLSKYLAMPSVEVIDGKNPLGTSISSLLLDGANKDYRNSNLLYLGGSFIGIDAGMLPYNLRFINFLGLTGNIEDFVSMAIAKGRTTGHLTLRQTLYSIGLYYNNTSFKTLIDGGQIPVVSDKVCVTWDALGNITFETSIPEGYEGIPTSSTWYVQKHSNS